MEIDSVQKESYKIGIIWANLESTNLGVAALAYSALMIFEEIAKRHNIKFEYLLWGGGMGDRNLKVSDDVIKIKERPSFQGGDMIRYLKNLIRRPGTFRFYLYIRELKQCDILVDTGEGDSYADIYGIERFRCFDYIKTQFHSSDKPYILLPQTIGPFASEEARRKARISLEKASAVIVRDKMSYDYCKLIAPNANLERSIDMAFFLPYKKSEKVHDGKVRIGVNISGLLWEGGYTKDNQFGLKADYRKAVIQLLDYLNEKDNVEVHLIGHVNGNESDIDDDWHVIKSLSDKYAKFILAPKFDSPVAVKSYISKMDFFTGARMHACIAAISSGVPVLPMAYSRKFNGLFIESLTYPHLVDLKTMAENEIHEKFISAFEMRDSIKKEIADIRHDIIEEEKNRMISLIYGFVR